MTKARVRALAYFTMASTLSLAGCQGDSPIQTGNDVVRVLSEAGVPCEEPQVSQPQSARELLGTLAAYTESVSSPSLEDALNSVTGKATLVTCGAEGSAAAYFVAVFPEGSEDFINAKCEFQRSVVQNYWIPIGAEGRDLAKRNVNTPVIVGDTFLVEGSPVDPAFPGIAQPADLAGALGGEEEVNQCDLVIPPDPPDLFVGQVDVGKEPYDVVVSPDGADVMVTNYGSGTVSVMDAATGAVNRTIEVGDSPVGIALAQDGSQAFLTNRSREGQITVVDVNSNTVSRTLDAGQWPYDLALSPDGSRVYVTNAESVDSQGSLSVIDSVSGSVVDTISLDNGTWGIAITSDGSRAFVSNSGSDTVSVVDLQSNAVLETIEVGGLPSGIAVSPDGERVYVANWTDATVSVIDVETNTVTNTISVGKHPESIGVSPDGEFVYVGDDQTRQLSTIATATEAVDAVDVGLTPSGVAVSPEGSRVYVATDSYVRRLNGSLVAVDPFAPGEAS